MSDRNSRKSPGRLLKAAHDLVFRRIHSSNLIYNTAWEDPRIDRQLLQFDSSSRVVMITSAGCNVLDYLLDGPQEIHSIDVNHRQNSLLELKLALFRKADFHTLFEMFGIGSHAHFEEIYRKLRGDLSDDAKAFWDKKITFFNPASLKRSFYYHGTSGLAAWVMGGALFRARGNIKNFALCLLDAESLAQQREIYAMLEQEIWGALSHWLTRQPALMALLGVPRPQIRLIDESHPGGLTAYVKDKLRHVMTELPTADNYFWRVYVTGSYTLSCCPNYLKRENFDTLASRVSHVIPHTCTISQFLQRNPGVYTHYVLLDHQDWLAWHDPVALREEWDLILANSRPGTKILMRSAGLDLSFVPADLQSKLRFYPELTAPMHLTDRVGTYGSLHMAEVL
ncbi:MAG: DUF3419 family protein [Roseimicrobium sp.]